jgi:hypothetical protein
MLPANTAGADPWHGHAPTESFCIHTSFGCPLGQGTLCGHHRLARWQLPVIWWRQHPDAIVLQGMGHLVDPRTHCSMGRYREHYAKEHSHEHQRQKHPSCTMRLSIYPRPSLPVQALQVLHPWILRHALCSGYCCLATTTHAAVPGGTHRILISGPQGSRLSAG